MRPSNGSTGCLRLVAQTLAAAEYPLRSGHIRPNWNSRALSSKGRNQPPERIEREKNLCNRAQLTSRDSSNDFFYNFRRGAYFCLAVNPQLPNFCSRFPGLDWDVHDSEL